MTLRKIKRRHMARMPFLDLTGHWYCFQRRRWVKFKQQESEKP